MSKRLLLHSVSLGESEVLEFKERFSDSVIETLVAFANTRGGEVLIGITDKGEIKGIQIGKETIQKWLNEIKLKTQPAIIPSFEVYSEVDKTVVGISVQEFPVKPLSFKGRYFKRISNSNHQLSAIEITELNLQSLQLSWDSYVKQNADLSNLNVDKINRFIHQVNKSSRFQLSGVWKQDLKKLKLITDSSISNAAWLLFSKDEIEYNIHLGRFKSPSLIVDDKILRLTLFDAVEETMKYIVSQLKFAFEITGKTSTRTEIPEYPLEAIRELVLNSIVHRDYLSPADLQIKIFDSEITFFNPGKLHSELSIQDLNTDSYPAFARNKLIAEAFYLTGEIEKYGSGFQRVRKVISAYPTMELNFKEIGGGFMISLQYTKQKTSLSSEKIEIFHVIDPKKVGNDPKKNENDPKKVVNDPKKNTDDPKKVVNDPKKNTDDPKKVLNDPKKNTDDPKKVVNDPKKNTDDPKKVVNDPKKNTDDPKKVVNDPKKNTDDPKKVVNDPNTTVEKRISKLLELIKKTPEISTYELAIQLKISEKTVKRYIAKLKEENKLNRIGPKNGGTWEIPYPIDERFDQVNEELSAYRKSKVVEKVVERVVDKVVDVFSDNQLKIISLIIEKPHTSAKEIAQKIGVSHRKTQSNIAVLKKKGYLKRIGPAKGGYWEVNE